MRPARFAAAVVLAGGALLASAPAASAASPTGSWTDPAPAEQVDGIPVAYVERAQQLQGQASFEGGIANVSFTLVQDAAGPGEPCSAAEEVLPQSRPGGGPSVSFGFDAPFPCNRRYQVRATVTPAQRPLQRDTPLVLNLWVAVAIPPAPTTGLRATPVGRTVELAWDASVPAPDAEGFQVQRAYGDGGFTPIGEAGPSETSFVDRDIARGGGAYRYRVVAMRSGPDEGTVVFSDEGDAVGADVAPVPGAQPGEGAVGSGGTGTGGGSKSVLPTGTARPRTVHRTFRPPSATRGATTATTIDTGYQETLPFQQPTGDDAAVVSRLDGDDDSGQRQTLLLVAGGTTAFSWAMLLRFLLRRAALPA